MNGAKISFNKILTIFLLSHFAIWVLVPSITNDNLPLDTIEALAWGSNLDWGFNKHPPLSAFAVEIFFQILIDFAPIIQKYPEQVQRKRDLTQKLNI